MVTGPRSPLPRPDGRPRGAWLRRRSGSGSAVACVAGRSLGARPPRPLHRRLSRAASALPPSRAGAGRCGPSRCVPSRHAQLLRASGDVTTVVFVGSPGTVSAPTHGARAQPPFPFGGSPFAAPLRRFRLRSACGPCVPSDLRCVSAAWPPVASGLPLLGLSKVLFRAPRPLLLEVGPSPVLPWVQGRVPGGCVWRLRAPVSGSPSVAQTAARECSPLHRLQRCAAALPWSRWPPLPAGSNRPAAPPKGYAQPGHPGAGDATPAAPASRPRRFSRPRRCDRTRSVVPRRFAVPAVRRVSATSCLLVSARVPGLSPVPAGVSAGPRLAGLPCVRPKGPTRSPAADPGVHRVSGFPLPGAAPLGAASRRDLCLSLDALLPIGAFTPCRRLRSPARPTRRSPGSGLPGPAFTAACLAVHASARPSRRWILVPGAPASLAITRSRRRGLSATRTRFRSPQRLRVASSGAGRLRVSAPLSSLLDLRVLPQAADRPAVLASVRRRPRSLASGVLPGLVLMRGRDRSPHPSVPLVHRRSPSGSHPGALVPVSRATHAWAASSSRGGRLQRLGGVASTHRPLPEGGVRCRLRRFPGDCSWDFPLPRASLSVRAPEHLSAVLRCRRSDDLSAPPFLEGCCLASLTSPFRSTVMPSSRSQLPGRNQLPGEPASWS